MYPTFVPPLWNGIGKDFISQNKSIRISLYDVGKVNVTVLGKVMQIEHHIDCV